MRKILTLISFLTAVRLLANDGSFTISGNQLVPTTETQIELRKEVLTIRLLHTGAEVFVHYEFFNPGPQKTIEVGFEAGSPAGDVHGLPKNGEHPYVHDFNVKMNDNMIKYKVQYVIDSLFEETRKYHSRKHLTLKQIAERNEDPNYIDFEYVYSFQATFKAGLNVIEHHYTCDYSRGMSGQSYNEGYNGIVEDFQYILTAAKRWANGCIDDFSLILESDIRGEYFIVRNFFESSSEWAVEGKAKLTDSSYTYDQSYDSASVKVRKSKVKTMKCKARKAILRFHKTKFKPKNEFCFYRPIKTDP